MPAGNVSIAVSPFLEARPTLSDAHEGSEIPDRLAVRRPVAVKVLNQLQYR